MEQEFFPKKPRRVKITLLTLFLGMIIGASILFLIFSTTTLLSGQCKQSTSLKGASPTLEFPEYQNPFVPEDYENPYEEGYVNPFE